MKQYKISELASILGISEQAVRSKVKRNILPSVEETIDNRTITFVPLENDELNTLIEKTRKNKNIYPTQIPTLGQPEENIAQPEKQSIDLGMVIDYLKQKDQQIENIYSILLDKERNIGEKDKQIYLLEDSESKKETEYLKQTAELKTIKSKHRQNLMFFSVLLACLSVALIFSLTYLLIRPPRIKEKIVKVQVVKIKPVPANMMKYYAHKQTTTYHTTIK